MWLLNITSSLIIKKYLKFSVLYLLQYNFPIFQHYVIPYLNLIAFGLIVIYLPLGSIPYPIIWLYDKILWLSDPLLLAVEVVLALNFVMHCSRRCAENIEDDEEEAWKWKVAFININLIEF